VKLPSCTFTIVDLKQTKKKSKPAAPQNAQSPNTTAA
jgi:hypothetical protein